MSPLLAPEGVLKRCVLGSEAEGFLRDDSCVEIRFLITGRSLMRQEMLETAELFILRLLQERFRSGKRSGIVAPFARYLIVTRSGVRVLAVRTCTL